MCKEEWFAKSLLPFARRDESGKGMKRLERIR